MKVDSLVKGLALLLALLIVAALVGGVGSPELMIWLVLVGAWVAWWLASRRRNRAVS